MAGVGDHANPNVIIKMPLLAVFKDAGLLFRLDSLGCEILGIALPAALSLAADPIASLMDTAFIGHIGPVELAAVGVSVAIFNQASRITIFPLVSITTSLVAKEDMIEKNKIGKASRNEMPEETIKSAWGVEMTRATEEDAKFDVLEKLLGGTDSHFKGSATGDGSEAGDSNSVSATESRTSNNDSKAARSGKKRRIPSASTALFLGAVLGVMQAVFLILGAKSLLNIMGVKSDSPMLAPAQKYLILRSLGAPAFILSLAMQGIFRGVKDTRTPLYAIVVGDLTNIALDPIFIFVLRLGVSGAAIAHIFSQHLIALILLWRLNQEVYLMPPSIEDLQIGQFLKNGLFLMGRVVAVTFCVTLSSSMAARLGSTQMAAFQICLQVWLTSSLLADGLAVAGQAILASAFTEKDYKKVAAATSRVLQMGFVLGLGLAAFVGFGLYFGSGIFSKDPNVLRIVAIGLPFVAGTQPVNSVAFVLDGVNFGASDFGYTAYSLGLVAIVSITLIFFLSRAGFTGIWVALTIYMGLRTIASLGRMATGTGPWKFLRGAGEEALSKI